jgi:hypothetical protein
LDRCQRKNLTTVYGTHGHGDTGGLDVIRERYPEVRAVPTARVLEHMKQQVSLKMFAAVWESRFPGLIQGTSELPSRSRICASNWEDHELVAVEAVTPIPTTIRAFTVYRPAASHDLGRRAQRHAWGAYRYWVVARFYR